MANTKPQDQNPSMTPEQISLVIRRSHQLGLRGFDGMCVHAAIAMNRIIFDNKATLIAAINSALFEKGKFVGHAGVEFQGTIWDVDGTPKTDDGENGISKYGKLDLERPSNKEHAESIGIAWTIKTATEVSVIRFSKEEYLLDIFEQDVGKDTLDFFKETMGDWPMTDYQIFFMEACKEILGKTIFPAAIIDTSRALVVEKNLRKN